MAVLDEGARGLAAPAVPRPEGARRAAPAPAAARRRRMTLPFHSLHPNVPHRHNSPLNTLWTSSDHHPAGIEPSTTDIAADRPYLHFAIDLHLSSNLLPNEASNPNPGEAPVFPALFHDGTTTRPSSSHSATTGLRSHSSPVAPARIPQREIAQWVRLDELVPLVPLPSPDPAADDGLAGQARRALRQILAAAGQSSSTNASQEYWVYWVNWFQKRIGLIQPKTPNQN